MVFKCQEDSFLQDFTTKVIKCEPTKESIVEYGKKSSFKGYEITLEDTILFPAGGGQPHDIGYLNDVQVYQVLRKGDQAVHFTKEPLEVGTVVKEKINWDRRFDHMQQHSGQHLLSAVLEKEYNLNTTSWWLGADECYIELDSIKVSEDIIKETEKLCNQYIMKAIPVHVKFCKIDDPSLDESVKKSLPKDCVETIRIICIQNIDENLCCGTHVSNLSQLQVIKLLGAEPGKKDKTNLRFLVGNRVVNTFQQMLDREKTLTAVLNNEPSKHEDLVKKLQKNYKSLNKNFQNLMFDFAKSDAQSIKISNPRPKYVFVCKIGVPLEYLRTFRDEMKGEDVMVVLASQDVEKPTEGYLIIDGPDDVCSDIAPRIIESMKAKGKLTKTGQFQGKADMSAINECNKIVEEHFCSISS